MAELKTQMEAVGPSEPLKDAAEHHARRDVGGRRSPAEHCAKHSVIDQRWPFQTYLIAKRLARFTVDPETKHALKDPIRTETWTSNNLQKASEAQLGQNTQGWQPLSLSECGRRGFEAKDESNPGLQKQPKI